MSLVTTQHYDSFSTIQWIGHKLLKTKIVSPKFDLDANFDMRRQLEHFEYDMNRKLLTFVNVNLTLQNL